MIYARKQILGAEIAQLKAFCASEEPQVAAAAQERLAEVEAELQKMEDGNHGS